MPRYRCQNKYCAEKPPLAIFDFDSHEPKCPKCGSHEVMPLVTMHFVVDDREYLHSLDKYRPFVACGFDFVNKIWHGTGEPWNVTCKECIGSDAYKKLYQPPPPIFLKMMNPDDQESCCG